MIKTKKTFPYWENVAPPPVVRKYTQISGMLNQVATDDPTSLTMVKSTTGNFVLDRTGMGAYTLTNDTPIFLDNRTWLNIQSFTGTLRATMYRQSDTVIIIETYNAGGAYSDGCLNNTAFEIRVYGEL